MTKLKVGDALFIPGTTHRNMVDRLGDRNVVVVKVGRKWAEVRDRDSPVTRWTDRLDMESMCLDGGSSGYGRGSRVYASRAAYEAEEALEKAWSDLVIQFRNHWGNRPIDMTVEKIRQVRHILGGVFLPKDETRS